MRQPRKPDPEVMESDYRIPTALGTAAWTAALVVLLAMGDQLPAEDRWWRWVCLTGIAFGVFGYVYIPRHLRSREKSGGDHPAEAGEGTGRPDAQHASAAGAEPPAQRSTPSAGDESAAAPTGDSADDRDRLPAPGDSGGDRA
ncbi:DUF2530 domain-containing protein [Streptomonospora sp. PA3]|nr:DUF2530 domain-containing protein [Streptomonospora sp. PA3]